MYLVSANIHAFKSHYISMINGFNYDGYMAIESGLSKWMVLEHITTIGPHIPGASPATLPRQEFVFCILLILWQGFDMDEASFGGVWLSRGWDLSLTITIAIDDGIHGAGMCRWNIFRIDFEHWVWKKTQNHNEKRYGKFDPNTVWSQEIDYIEYFAGVGNISKHMRSARYRVARLDIKDHTPDDPTRTNYMDLNSSSGYAFLWLCCLHCRRSFVWG